MAVLVSEFAGVLVGKGSDFGAGVSLICVSVVLLSCVSMAGSGSDFVAEHSD